jgi:hypothetical protein
VALLRSRLEDARFEAAEMGRRACHLQARLEAARGASAAVESGGAAAGEVAAGGAWGAEAAARAAAEAAEAAAKQAEALAALSEARADADEARQEVRRGPAKAAWLEECGAHVCVCGSCMHACVCVCVRVRASVCGHVFVCVDHAREMEG